MRNAKLALAAVGMIASTLALSAPAKADIVRVDASSIQGENVLFNSGTQSGTTVTGTTNTGTRIINFTGTSVGGSSTITANGGQASIEGAFNLATNSPSDTLNLQTLSFRLADGGTFNNLEFNLAAAAASTVSFSFVDNMGDVFNFANVALGNGSNFFGFVGINGQSIRSASLTFSAGGVGSVQQIRLDAVALSSAVPEPATWAMMLIGFGAVGHSMRKRSAKARGGLLALGA